MIDEVWTEPDGAGFSVRIEGADIEFVVLFEDGSMDQLTVSSIAGILAMAAADGESAGIKGIYLRKGDALIEGMLSAAPDHKAAVQLHETGVLPDNIMMHLFIAFRPVSDPDRPGYVKHSLLPQACARYWVPATVGPHGSSYASLSVGSNIVPDRT